MITEVVMPKSGMAMEEGTILSWLKQPGEYVEKGEPLLEIETDKLSMEIDAEESGYLIEALYDEGSTVPVASVIAYLGDKDEVPPAGSPPEKPAEKPASTPGKTPTASSEKSKESATAAPVTKQPISKQPEGKIPASPAAKQRAAVAGISLEQAVRYASSSEDMLHLRDVEKALRRISAGGQAEPAGHHMQKPGRAAQQFTLYRYARIETMTELRKQLKNHFSAGTPLEKEADTGPSPSPSLSDLLLFGVLRALEKHPEMQDRRFSVPASLPGNSPAPGGAASERQTENGSLDIGILVAGEDDFLQPVLRSADKLSLRELAKTRRELTQAALSQESGTESDGTDDQPHAGISFSNLGMFGITGSAGNPAPGEYACIQTGMVDRVAGVRNGELVVEKRLNLTLTFDTQIVGGTPALRFFDTLVLMIENPQLMLSLGTV
ncbi:MAG: 2-oxo acid dehydrogenase subunit E2 [Spirochaetales bacterium]|nr:2-oxo acid dehydrogenase subunit E2 [Spirochaetales bacterium]MCF7937471.1 2-oxo acid dehydrogenase subunit E2 [Spirochaetales bacterium]